MVLDGIAFIIPPIPPAIPPLLRLYDLHVIGGNRRVVRQAVKAIGGGKKKKKGGQSDVEARRKKLTDDLHAAQERHAALTVRAFLSSQATTRLLVG